MMQKTKKTRTWSKAIVFLHIVAIYYVHIVTAQVCEEDDICLCNDESSNRGLKNCRSRNCFCDKRCTERGDCCKDYNPLVVNDSLQRPWINDVISCKLIPEVSDPLSHIVREPSYLVIDRCWPNFPDFQLTVKCSRGRWDSFNNNDVHWPVVGRRSGYLYRNIFCSTCNEEYDVKFLVASTTCEQEQQLLRSRTPLNDTSNVIREVKNAQEVQRLTGSQCEKIDYFSDTVLPTCDHPDNLDRKFIPVNPISHCSDEWVDDNIRVLCENYTSYVSAQLWYQDEVQNYKNWHCLQCNNNRSYGEAQCSVRTNKRKSNEPDPGPPGEKGPQRGSNGASYFPMSLLFDINGGKMLAKSRVGLSVGDIDIKTETETRECEDGYLALGNECSFIYCGEAMVFRGLKCVPVATKQRARNFEDVIHSSYNEFADVMFPPHNKTADVMFSPYNTTEETVPGKSCLHSDVSHMSYSMFDNGSLFIDSLHILVDAGSVSNISVNGSFALLACLPTNIYSNNVTLSYSRTVPVFTLKYNSAQTVLSLVGQITSTVALVVLLIVYSILPPLRNVPGKCLISLAVSLCTAQMLHLVGIGRFEPHELCYSFAILIHYFYLSSFFWMNVLSFDMFRIFGTSFTSSFSSGTSGKFLHYTLYGWLAPSVIVIVSSVIDLVLEESEDSEFEIRPKYGEVMCFISNRNALLVFFVVPVAILITLNVVFFFMTVRGIHAAMKTSVLARNAKKKRWELFVYLKVSMVMGLTWLFGFLQATTNESPILVYVFIILNSFQGLIISLLFLLTKTVFKEMGVRYRKSFRQPATKTVSQQKALSSASRSSETCASMLNDGPTMSSALESPRVPTADMDRKSKTLSDGYDENTNICIHGAR